MEIRGNYHTHSTFCDGKNTIAEMAEAAFHAGATHLGFSGHIDPGVLMQDIPGYFREVDRLRAAYAGRMHIFRGIELDNAYKRSCADSAEYIIGSTHFIPVQGSPVWENTMPIGNGAAKNEEERIKELGLICVDNTAEILHEGCKHYYDGDYYRMAADYYRFESMVVERLQPTFIGHFDLITRFNDLPAEESGHFLDETDARYLKPAEESMEKLAAAQIPFELNLGALNRGRKKEPYPRIELLKYLHTLGGEIIVSSDAHDRDHIFGGFGEGIAALRKAGFDHVLILVREKTGRPAANTCQDADYFSCDQKSKPLYWREIEI